MTGPSPVDRGKPGSKIHAMSDRAGLPLAVAISAANTNDSYALKPLVTAIPAITSRRGPRRRKPAKLHADKAYDQPDLTAEIVSLHSISTLGTGLGEMTAEQRMWEHYVRETADGRTPNGAELDRVAGTHNYGRRILRQWRAAHKIPSSRRSGAMVAQSG